MHLLWRLACAQPHHLFLYMHNKGATRHKHPGVRAHRRRHRASRPLSYANTLGTRRTLEEMVLFQEVVAGWRAVLAVDAYG